MVIALILQNKINKTAEIEEELRSIVETEEIKNKISEEFKKTFG